MTADDLDVKVLARIAQGENTFYALTKKLRVGSNDGVLAALGRLVDWGFIERGPEGSRGTQPYMLKADGFDEIIRHPDYIDNWERFAELSKSHFPLVFGYWSSLMKFGLRNWILKTLRGQVRRIDAEVFGQIYSGDRVRYSHEEFVQDLYSRIYGPWFTMSSWEELSEVVPVEGLRAFLHGNPDVLVTRERDCIRLLRLTENIISVNKSYRGTILNPK